MRFGSVDDVERALREADYLPDQALAAAIYLALAMRRPLLLEGEAGVGKTEVAKTLYTRVLQAAELHPRASVDELCERSSSSSGRCCRRFAPAQAPSC
jgi:hypothetical protein